MQNFSYSIPTKVEFGKGAVKKLPEFVREFGERVLLVYGGGSIKRSGLYATVVKLLDANGIYHAELSGVEPNPRTTTADKGAKICKEENIQVVLPIGGGSTIDCAKAISAGAFYDGPVWDLVSNPSLVTKALPIITILTLAATGSEMDVFSVISNMETNEKKGAYLQERIMEGMLKTRVHYGPIACKDPENYEARANLMWTASWAINGFISCGKRGAWACHPMEHQLRKG